MKHVPSILLISVSLLSILPVIAETLQPPPSTPISVSSFRGEGTSSPIDTKTLRAYSQGCTKTMSDSVKIFFKSRILETSAKAQSVQEFLNEIRMPEIKIRMHQLEKQRVPNMSDVEINLEQPSLTIDLYSWSFDNGVGNTIDVCATMPLPGLMAKGLDLNAAWHYGFYVAGTPGASPVSSPRPTILESQFTNATDYKLATYQAAGLTELKTKEISGVLTHVYITDEAKRIIDNGELTEPDPDFNMGQFTDAILSRFENSIAYFKVLDPTQPLRDLHLIIEFSKTNEGISDTKIGTRVMGLNLNRWHKYIVRKMDSYLALTSIHEFAHAVNYVYDIKEEKLHREFNAVLFECLNLIRIYGTDSFKANYLASYSNGMPSPNEVLSTTYTGMKAVRLYAATLASQITVSELEQLAVAYLRNPQIGDAGFDDAAQSINLRININKRNPNYWTFQHLRAEAVKTLTATQNPTP